MSTLLPSTDNTWHGADISSQGYVEIVASSRKKTKEALRTGQLIPENILQGNDKLEKLLESYYDFMNIAEFVYQDRKDFSDVILSNKAVFRISLSENNNQFFTDDLGANSILVVTDVTGVSTIVNLEEHTVLITNGNDLPGTLSEGNSQIGKTFTVLGLDAYNTATATLSTDVKYWAGPGPSYVMNTIEEAMDIDNAGSNYLELIQKEIAASIPRSVATDKRTLYKAIVDFYKIRGSADSIEIFFNLLFNEKVEITYPWDKTLIPSSGTWEPHEGLGKYDGRFTTNKGFTSYDIKIQDSLRYQKFSYNIRTGRNISDWEASYNRLVHPSGFTFFGEILMIIELTKVALGESDFNLSSSDQLAALNRKVLSAMPFYNKGVIGIEDLVVLIQSYASTYLPTPEAKMHRSLLVSPKVLSAADGVLQGTPELAGKLVGFTYRQIGYGYDSAPIITFTGDGTGASATAVINDVGEVIDVVITNAGQNYTIISATATPNSNFGTIAGVELGGGYNKTFKRPPLVRFSEPTSTDAKNVLLATNVTAEGIYTIETNVASDNYGEITGFTLTNPGHGYVDDPIVYVSSSQYHEQRAKQQNIKLILPLNHTTHLERTNINNNSYNLKSGDITTDAMRFNFNNTFNQMGHYTFDDITQSSINKYNVNSFITKV